MSEADGQDSTTSSFPVASPDWPSSSATSRRPPTTCSTPSCAPSPRPATPSSTRGPAPAGPRVVPSPQGMRAVAADPSPFAQLAAVALLDGAGTRPCSTPPSPSWPRSRRVDVPLRQHIEELYATRCAACRRAGRRRPVHLAARRRCAGRKIYRCEACDALASAAPRSGPRRSTRSTSPSSASSAPTAIPSTDRRRRATIRRRSLPPAPIGV